MLLKSRLRALFVTAVTFFSTLTTAQVFPNDGIQAGDARVFEIARDARIIPLSSQEAQKVLDDPFTRWTNFGEIVSGIRRYIDFSVVYRASQNGYFTIGITKGDNPSGEPNTFFIYQFNEIKVPYPQIGRCFNFQTDGVNKFVVFETTVVKQALELEAYVVDAPEKNPKIGSIRAQSPIREFCIARAFTDSPRVKEFFGEAGIPFYSFWGMRARLPTPPLP